MDQPPERIKHIASGRMFEIVRNVGATNPFPFEGAPPPKLTPVTWKEGFLTRISSSKEETPIFRFQPLVFGGVSCNHTSFSVTSKKNLSFDSIILRKFSLATNKLIVVFFRKLFDLFFFEISQAGKQLPHRKCVQNPAHPLSPSVRVKNVIKTSVFTHLFLLGMAGAHVMQQKSCLTLKVVTPPRVQKMVVSTFWMMINLYLKKPVKQPVNIGC